MSTCRRYQFFRWHSCASCLHCSLPTCTLTILWDTERSQTFCGKSSNVHFLVKYNTRWNTAVKRDFFTTCLLLPYFLAAPDNLFYFFCIFIYSLLSACIHCFFSQHTTDVKLILAWPDHCLWLHLVNGCSQIKTGRVSSENAVVVSDPETPTVTALINLDFTLLYIYYHLF